MAVIFITTENAVVVDVFSRLDERQERGSAIVTIHMYPTVHGTFDMGAEDSEWLTPHFQNDMNEEHVRVELEISSPDAYPVTLYARWKEDQAVKYGMSNERLSVLLDGTPREMPEGAMSAFGGPERVPGLDPPAALAEAATEP